VEEGINIIPSAFMGALPVTILHKHSPVCGKHSRSQCAVPGVVIQNDCFVSTVFWGFPLATRNHKLHGQIVWLRKLASPGGRY
jgi:hypothetical protein